MKKILIYLLGITVAISSCDKKSDLNIDGKTVDERIAASLASYQQKLVNAPYGWILRETTSGTALNGGVTQNGPKAVFSYYVKFDKDNKVSMISDFDTTMAFTFQSSTFQIKAIQRPTLVFDTYSYIHVPCDPDASISKSPIGDGFGWGTDFEFSFADNVGADELGDTIHLTGNLNSCQAVLIKATAADQQSFTTSGFQSMRTINKILTYFKRFTINGTTVEMTPGIGGRTIDIQYTGHSDIINVPLAYSSGDLIFGTPVNIGTGTVSSLTNLTWDNATQTIATKVNGTTDATISGATAPLNPQPQIATDFYNTGFDVPWLAPMPFHVNGVDDAFNIRALTASPGAFLFFVFYPGGYGGQYDIITPYFNNSSPYKYVYTGGISATTVNNGQLYFSILYANSPSTNPVGIAKTISLLQSGQTTYPAPTGPQYGFYIIPKEDGYSYDMVNAGGATAWINWIPNGM
ncbi:DUF4302 domain-containing protein [Chitinophaga sp. 30R24]|uniref:DUF4302 domain-containing protein n=1 Tax=Chitinophaga sp. 30R24 TaxID=3248838 RepID=UPI003B8ECABD